MDRRVEVEMPRLRGLGALAVFIVIIIGLIAFQSIGRVGVGYVAVVVDPVLGRTTAVGDGANARYFLKAPWASVREVYVATDSINMWSDRTEAGDFPAVEALTRDGLMVDVDITVRWRVSPDRVVDLFRRFPRLDWKDRAIIPIIRESIRDLIVDFTAIETIESRGMISALLVESLAGSFEGAPSLAGAVLIDAVNLRRIALPEKFVDAIESKLASEQLAIAAEFNRTRILVLANATATSEVLRAEGIARSRVVVANGTREAIESIAELDPEIDRAELSSLYLYLETLRDISQQGKSTFLIVPSDTGQFIVSVPK